MQSKRKYLLSNHKQARIKRVAHYNDMPRTVTYFTLILNSMLNINPSTDPKGESISDFLSRP